MKKILLVIALLITTLGLNAQNIGDNTIINYDGYSITYTVTGENPAECEVTKITNPTTETSITIPTAVTIEGTEFIVTSIRDFAAQFCNKITSIKFEEDTQIRLIDDMCFSYCANLTSLEIPSSVTTIGIGVFYNTKIESIEIPKNVTSIGHNPSNINTTKIIVEEGNPVYDSRENCNAIIETLTNTLIVGCKNTIIPNNIISIGRNAFTTSGITTIDIPASVNTINDYAFSSCYNLSSITCHALYTPKTYDETFSECPSNMTIYVPAAAVNDYKTAKHWKEFNIVAMENSSSPLAVGDNITIDYINYSLKYKVTSINPAECEVSYIGNMNTPAPLIIPSTVMINGNSVAVTSIADLRYLIMTELYIPRSIKSINSIMYNNKLTKVVFEEGSQLSSIDCSFWDCPNLTSLELPKGLTSIESWSIGFCPKLTTLICHAETAPYANSSFNFHQLSSDMTIYVPEESIASYKAEEPWNQYRIIGMRKDHFIGEGNQTSSYLPLHLNYYTSYSQQIYTADEITSDGKCMINSIAFKQSDSYNRNANIKVYMKNTIKSEFENNGDWIETNDSDLVFEGNVTFEGNADTWTTINLEKSFYYTGRNLLLCVEYHTDNYSGSSPEFYVYDTNDESMRSLSYSSDYYNEEDGISSMWGELGSNVNQIKFTLESTDLDLTIDETSSNNYYNAYISSIPVYNDFDNVLSQQLYTAEEISLIDCVIGKIGFKQANDVNATCKFKVYMTNTTLESFNGEEDMIPLNDSELVFDGEVTFKGNPGTWCFINLDKEFKYTGDNIALSILDYTNEYIYPYPEFYTYGDPNYNSTNRHIEFLYYDEENNTYIYNGISDCTNVVKFARDYKHNITIGQGDEVCYYLPYDPYYTTSQSQQIYTEEEIVCLNDTIKTIAFRQSNNAVTSREFKIHMQNTTKSSFENASDWVSTSDDDLVYDGYVTFEGNTGGWTYINLTKPFYYTGNNIMVDVTDYTYRYSDEVTEFYVYTTDTERSLTKNSWPSNTTQTNNFVNQIKLGFSKAEIHTAIPTNLYAEQDYLNVKLYWDEVANAESYNVYKDGVFMENVKEAYFETYDLEIETVYCFSVSSINGEYESPRCEEVCTWAMDWPITAPEVYGEAIDEYSIMLSWDPVENALSYNVYGLGTVTNITETTYILEGLEPNTDYCFEVSSVRNNTEVRTPYEICVMTFDLPISTPENLVATAISTSEITLTWDEVENALSYNVYRDDEFIANVNETNYSANNLDYYTEYCFSVTAVRNEQESESSDSDCAKTFDLPITAPEVYGEAIDEYSIMLSWDPVDNAISYNIYGFGTVFNITDTIYIAENLEPNTDYCFEVSTVRNNTEVRTPYEICVMTFDLPITTPENLVAEATSTSEITLTWDEVENALSYNVYQNNNFIANVNDNNYSVNNLDYYTEYCFSVTAVRNEQESESSDSDCAKTFDLPITTPENLVATAISTSEITLTWDEVENAFSYNVYRDDEFIANVNETNYSANNLDYYTEYCFSVTAVRNEQESESSDSDCAKTFDLPITTPENLVATAISTSEITLIWNEVENALSYNVYRDDEFIANVNETNYSANNLDYYTEYCFSVTAIRNEQESESSDSDCAKTFDLPITTPENLVATAISTSEITLTWDEVENALSYNVYQNNNFIANVNDNNYSVNNLDYYTEYCFSVTAVRNEQESESSDSDCAKTFDLPITTPENLVATAISTSEITLTWDEVENALSYNVYRDDEFITNVNETNYSANNLDYYTEYCFSVTAVRNEQESESSDSDCAKTFDLPITTPENLVATAISTSEITLTWDEVENALSYNVYQNNNFIANVNDNNYSANNLDYYTEYCFSVTAVRNEQESESSDSDCAKTFDLPITTPENLVATAISTSEITLTWDEVENALSYNVYQNNNFIANVTENNYSVNNLDYYTEYCFTVTAVRNEQESENSNSDCAKTFDLPISTPENLVATAISTSEITLTWDEVENALSYNVYQNNNFIANVNDYNYSVNNLDYYTEYCFTITAVRNEQESESSDSDCAKTFDLPITTPENLVATAISTSEITLTWNEVENALSYNVYRDDEFVANVSNANYSDEELEYNTEYCYSVTAVRNEQESELSEKVCIKTLGEGIEEITTSYQLYPNPAKDKLYIITDDYEYVEEISVYTLSGVLIYKEIDFNNKSIDVSNMVSGVYFIKIKTENETFVQKFIKE